MFFHVNRPRLSFVDCGHQVGFDSFQNFFKIKKSTLKILILMNNFWCIIIGCGRCSHLFHNEQFSAKGKEQEISRFK